MYCSTLRPHLPRLHGWSGSQAIPISARAMSRVSVAADHSVVRSGIPSRCGNASQITLSVTPGFPAAAAARQPRASTSEGIVLRLPTQTSSAVPAGRSWAASS